MWDLLCEKKTLFTVRSYSSEQFIAGNNKDKSPNKSTGLEIELTKYIVSS